MNQFRKDMAVLAELAFWMAVGILLALYTIGTGFLVWTCGCV